MNEYEESELRKLLQALSRKAKTARASIDWKIHVITRDGAIAVHRWGHKRPPRVFRTALKRPRGSSFCASDGYPMHCFEDCTRSYQWVSEDPRRGIAFYEEN